MIRMHIYTKVVQDVLGIGWGGEWNALSNGGGIAPNGSHLQVKCLGIFTVVILTGYSEDQLVADGLAFTDAQDAYVRSAGLWC
jgi:hypothetical protein